MMVTHDRNGRRRLHAAEAQRGDDGGGQIGTVDAESPNLLVSRELQCVTRLREALLCTATRPLHVCHKLGSPYAERIAMAGMCRFVCLNSAARSVIDGAKKCRANH